MIDYLRTRIIPSGSSIGNQVTGFDERSEDADESVCFRLPVVLVKCASGRSDRLTIVLFRLVAEQIVSVHPDEYRTDFLDIAH